MSSKGPLNGANSKKLRSFLQEVGVFKIVNSPKQRVLRRVFGLADPPTSGEAPRAVQSLRTLMKSAPLGAKRQFLEGLRDKARHAMDLLEQSTDPATKPHYFQQVQNAFSEKYFKYVPFNKRWDDITANLAVLGKVSTGNVVVPFRDSGKAYEHMWAAVDGARRVAHWQTYICKDDAIGRKTIDKLICAQERGCNTELLYDCGGNISGRARLVSSLRGSGASVIAYRPFVRSFLRYVLRGFDWKRSPGLRNHRKILIVDDDCGFCGGLNIGNEYCGKSAGGTGTFRDSHVMVQGPAAAHLAQVYEDTKDPRPWKYGLSRFRQIASIRLQQQYSDGKMIVNEAIVEKGKDAVARGGIYVQRQLARAKRGTSEMIQKTPLLEAKRKEELMNLYDTLIPPHTYSSPPSSPSSSVPAAAAAAATTETAAPPSSGGANEENAATATSVETPAEALELHPEMRSTIAGKAMKRKILAARTSALYNASSLPHKRAFTKLLLHLPIDDTEPVPEAEMYGKLRQSTVQIVSSNPRYRDFSIQYTFWQVTRKCHRRIWITTPYYLPTRKLLRALLHAASRGVDVRILSGGNKTTDPWWMWHASNYITQQLLRGGVKIYEFDSDQVMHAKTVVADSIWSSVGSYNWDVLSNKNLEVCLCTTDYATAREMEAQFLQDAQLSKEVRLEDHLQRSWWLRFVSWFFYHGVYILDRITFHAFSNADIEDRPGPS